MKQKRFSVVAKYVCLLLLAVGVLFPVAWMVGSSFKPATELFTRPPIIVTTHPTAEWYRAVVTRSDAVRLFLNSFVIALVTMVLNIVIASLAAYSVTRFRYRGRNLVLYSSLATYVFPPIVLLVPLYLIIQDLGLVDTRLGVIIPHTLLTLPFSLWLLRAFFASIPIEMDEAARVDGASHFGVYRRIIMPMAAPGLFATGLLAFIISWSEFLFSSVILTSGDKKTLPVGIAEFITSFDIRWGEIMALGTITTIPIVIFFLLIQRQFVAGFLGGGVKG